MTGTITLIGSGELTDSMVKVHRSVLARAGADAAPVFVDTPAGFELNVDEISARAVDYFRQHLETELHAASVKSRHASHLEISAALDALRHAKYILAGPGSPSYAVTHWQDTPVWNMMVKRWQSGAHLVFASAAAICLGRRALPVYEIFKAGHAVQWTNGLDLLAQWELDLAIVPHWNNAEGRSFDTRFCFMGEPRLKVLEAQLDPGTAILGVDEHTAITLDPATQTGLVAGTGQVTWRHAGIERHWPAGTTLTFGELRAVPRPEPASTAPTWAPTNAPRPELESTAQYLEQLAQALQAGDSEPEIERQLLGHAHDAMHELAQGWGGADRRAPAPVMIALIDLLVLTRTRLRTAKQYALADQLRTDLAAIGIQIQDTADGPVWTSDAS